MNWPRWVVHVFLGWAMVFNMIPPIALASAWFTMERAVGLDNTFTGLILAHATLNLPMALWLMGVFVRDVPQELDEAARIDGAATRRCSSARSSCRSSRPVSRRPASSPSSSAGTSSRSRST